MEQIKELEKGSARCSGHGDEIWASTTTGNCHDLLWFQSKFCTTELNSQQNFDTLEGLQPNGDEKYKFYMKRNYWSKSSHVWIL
jgi:hypothetical protein